MNSYLRQATAAQTRAVGPFVDDTDFKTTESGLTIANTDVKLITNGGASANKNSGGGTHLVNGEYALTFDATDTAAVGELQISIVVAGALPVRAKYWVLEEAVYDALFAASAPGYGTAQTGDSFARIGALGAGLTALPWNSAWDAEVQSEATDALNAYDPPTNAELTARTLASASYATATALDTVDNLLDTEIGALTTAVAAVKAVTDALPNAGALTSLATQASVNTIDDLLDTEIPALTTALAAVKAVTDLLPNGGALTSLATAANLATAKTAIDAIKVVTDALPDAGALTSLLADLSAILDDTGTSGVLVDATAKTGYRLSATGIDDLLDEVLTELAAIPSAAPTLRQAVQLLYQALRNETTTTAATQTIANSAGTVIGTAPLSDDGATFEKGKFV